MTQNRPVPADIRLTTIAMAYRNRRMIADEVLPRYGVPALEYIYWEYDLAGGFSAPETAVGRTGQPNRVKFALSEKRGSTTDHALDDVVPLADAYAMLPEAQGKAAGRATERLTNLIALRREIRVAGLVFNPATYPEGNTLARAGAERWTHADSSPVTDITRALANLIMRPNTLVLGYPTWLALSQHPQVIKAITRSDGDTGIATREEVARLFELDKVLVGEAFVNMARKGQEIDTQACWGPHAALYYLDQLGGPQDNPSFGFTAQFGSREAAQWQDQNVGMRGGTVVRVGESVEEVIAAPRLGYLFHNAGAAAA